VFDRASSGRTRAGPREDPASDLCSICIGARNPGNPSARCMFTLQGIMCLRAIPRRQWAFAPLSFGPSSPQFPGARPAIASDLIAAGYLAQLDAEVAAIGLVGSNPGAAHEEHDRTIRMARQERSQAASNALSNVSSSSASTSLLANHRAGSRRQSLSAVEESPGAAGVGTGILSTAAGAKGLCTLCDHPLGAFRFRVWITSVGSSGSTVRRKPRYSASWRMGWLSLASIEYICLMPW
jgi:hypothetical protein